MSRLKSFLILVLEAWFLLSQIPVRNKRELTVLLIVRDQNGQIFANASSLDIKWSSSDSNLARISQRSSPNLKIKSNQTASGMRIVSYMELPCL